MKDPETKIPEGIELIAVANRPYVEYTLKARKSGTTTCQAIGAIDSLCRKSPAYKYL